MKGHSMLKAFMAEHSLGYNFLTSRDARIVALRVEFIRKVRAANLSKAEIARLTGLNTTTIGYWLNEDVRQEKIRRRRVRFQRAALRQCWEECAQAMEAA